MWLHHSQGLERISSGKENKEGVEFLCCIYKGKEDMNARGTQSLV